MTTPGEPPSLLKDRRYLSYLGASFLNAFNDNAFKNIVSFIVLGMAATAEDASRLLAIASAFFIVPFLLFSSWAGTLADKFSKRSVFVVMHFYEVFAMALAALGFYLGSTPLMLAALFWTGAQSAFYSPAKYGLLPESLPGEALSKANGYLQAATFVAVVLGTAFGPFALSQLKGDPTLASLLCGGFALLGLFFSLGVWHTAPAAPAARVVWWNPFGEVFATLRRSLPNAPLGAPMVGLAYFWFLGAIVQLSTLLFAKQVLFTGLADDVVIFRTGILLTLLSLGIGGGSVLAGRWSGPKVEVGIVPLGALVTSAFLLDLGFFARDPVRAGADLFFLGIGAGLFAVPLQAAVQSRAPEASRGAVMAGSNFLVFLGILASSGLLPVFDRVFGGPAGVLAFLGAANLLVALGLCLWLAEFFLRFIAWLVTHTIYDIRIHGARNVPAKGPALLVSNHVSFIDAVLVGACHQRFIRFLMHRDYFDNPLFRPFCRMMKAIPILPGRRESTEAALARAAEELKAGHLVCIFAEGAITRTGNLLPFRRGLEEIARSSGAPIVPVHLGGVWGSIFSFEGGRAVWKWPRQIPYPATVSFGAPLPPESTADEVRSRVAELGAEEMKERAASRGTLCKGFLRAARTRWFSQAVADSSGLALTYGRFLALSYLLGRRLAELGPEKHIGLVLPPSVGGAAANVAAGLAGKTAVNLNFTASREAVASAIERCGITTVVTARAFREKVKVDLAPAREVYLEDILAGIPRWRILATELALFLLPLPLLRLALLPRGVGAEDAATVIFSSGSTGLPKGVVLTHANIRANAEGLAQVFDVRPNDRILGALPFFHSFGFTGTLWFPLVAGFGALYHANPLDPKGIARLAREGRATILLATPTFASAYLRRISPEDFATLRIAVVGAERLSGELARAWEAKYGRPLLEGYGTTECAPVVAVNLPGEAKEGSIGQPIPGVAVRIVDPDTRAPRKTGEEGMLEVKGANVMKGYLGEPERTAEVLRDGWYTTGDIAVFDREGYIRITGRLSRFSKIAGEMVPHGRVEEALLSAAGAEGPVLVVTGVRDAARGERLVVLHTSELDADLLGKKLRESGLPNLWIPRADDFHRVDSIPLLGTGKLDLRAIQLLAEERAGEVKV